MRVAILGRSQLLLNAARLLLEAGHTIGLIGTCRAEGYYAAGAEDFEGLASQCGADFFNSPKINDAEIVARLRAAGCDIGVSVNWLTVIGRDAIASFPHGILNAHAGDLPRYRGNACANWAIINGEPHVGLCVHQMVPGELDSGDVLVRDRFPLTEDVYIGDVYAWLERRIPELFRDALAALGRPDFRAEPQSLDPSVSLRCYPRRPSDGLIDWRQDVDAIHKLVRASSRPFDGAFTYLEGERKLTVWRAEPWRHAAPFLAVPGQVLLASDGAPVVAAASGALRLTEVTDEAGEDARPQILRSLRQRLSGPL